MQITQVGKYSDQISSELSEIYYRRFTIIIPAYNEEKRIKPVLKDIVKFVSENSLPWEVIVSIDGNDGTADIVETFSETYPFVSYTNSSGRGGKGGAIIRASSFAKGDFVILMDADNSMEFSEVVGRIPLIQDYASVILSRYHDKGDIPFIRKFISRGFNFLVNSILKLNIKDTQSGYKIINAKMFKKAMNKVTFTNGFLDVALLYYLKKEGSKTIEIPVKYNHNKNSKFHAFGEIIGDGISLIAFRIRQSRIYKYIPDFIVKLYYKIFKWI